MKRFRLALVNAAEDVPRLIRAYGKACGGEFGMVLRPLESRGVLVHMTREATRVWRGTGTSTDARELAPAEVRQTDRGLRLVATGGPRKGIEWVPYDHALMAGKEVTIAFYRDDQFASVVNASAGDAPLPPSELIDAKAGIALLKKAQEGVERETPITLRGQWSGYLYCDDQIPRVELVRKIAAYGTLTITSERGRWRWRVDRGERWFARPTTEDGIQDTLVAAVEHGLGVTMSVLGEACSFRDVHRRAAGDPAWGATHPIKPAKEGKDPTERLREPKGKRRAADPVAVQPSPPPAASETAVEAAVVAAEAADLGGAAPEGFAWVDPPSQHDLATWFFVHLLPSVGDAIVTYDGGADRPLGPFLEGLAVEIDAAGFDPKKAAEAHQALDRVREALTAAPKLMERARRLIGRAHALARSGLCTGEDRAQAMQAVVRAEAAYEEARSAIVAGESVDGVKTLKRIGTEVALAAAKAARACARGQKRLVPEPEVREPAKVPKLRVVDTKPRTARALIDRLLSETTISR